MIKNDKNHAGSEFKIDEVSQPISRHSETSYRRRKHLTSLLKREGFVHEETRLLGEQRLSETWSKVSGYTK